MTSQSSPSPRSPFPPPPPPLPQNISMESLASPSPSERARLRDQTRASSSTSSSRGSKTAVFAAAAPRMESMSSSDEPDTCKRNDRTAVELCVPSKWLWFGGCLCQEPVMLETRHELVLLHMGRYFGTIRRPGAYCINSCCMEKKKVSTHIVSQDLNNLKVMDANGNPLCVSAVVTWSVDDARKATLDVANYTTFLTTQAEVATKQICSAYPYEARLSGDGAPHAPSGSVPVSTTTTEASLKTETRKVSDEVVRNLQQKVDAAGLRIWDVSFNELSYAPEIASQMLVRQQTDATLDARKVLVDGAIDIAHRAAQNMISKHMLTDETASTFTSTLVLALMRGPDERPRY